MDQITRANNTETTETVKMGRDFAEAASGMANKRPALGEIAHNRVNNRYEQDEDTSIDRSSSRNTGKSREKVKGGKRGVAASASRPATPLRDQFDGVNNANKIPSPASLAAAEDLVEAVPELSISHTPDLNVDLAPLPSKAVLSTENRLSISPFRADRPLLNSSVVDVAVEARGEVNGTVKLTKTDKSRRKQSIGRGVGGQTSMQASEVAIETAVSPDAFPVSNLPLDNNYHVHDKVSTPVHCPELNLQKSDSVMESEIDDTPRAVTHYDKLEKAAVDAATPPRTSSMSTPQTESQDPMEAVEKAGNNEEALTPMGAAETVEDTEEALNVPNEAVDGFTPANAPETPVPATKSKPKKAAPVVRTTKASQARISLAHGPKDTPRAPTLGRPRQASAESQSPSRRVVSGSSDQSNDGKDGPGEKREVVIPHSKARPMSMSFPTPPPLFKSNKAPTQSTFQLPGEAVAAKLRAAREARQLKEGEDENKKREFKARPVPSSMHRPLAVRQTSASKAREARVGRPPSSSASHVRAQSVAVIGNPANGVGDVIGNGAEAAGPGRRSSTAAAGAKPRTSSSGTGNLLNRATLAASNGKTDRAEAVKTARAAAYAQGRQSSREWAEKQRLKKAAAAKLDAQPVLAPQQAAEPEG